jgi:putative heme iron utilization protein
MDSVHLNTEISMYAENLGKYPPNTALMVITDGAKRKEIFLSSSLTQNSSVILKKRKR